jgi:serine protease Do
MQTVTPALAKAMGLSQTEGVLVDSVTPGSPAAQAGLQQGDVILSFNGQHIEGPRDLAFAVADTPAGKTANVSIDRQGRERALEVTIGTEHTQKVAAANSGEARARLGLELAPLSEDQRQQLGVPDGALVANVNPGSPAEDSGLQSGDVILRVGQHKVTSPNEAVAEIRAAENEHRTALPLLILRGGQTAYLALQLTPGTG